MALHVIKLPEYTWVDVYSETGIDVGTPLLLDSYQNHIDLVESDTMPMSINELGFPLSAPSPGMHEGSPRENSTQLLANAPGLWARPSNPRVPAWLIVQIDTTSPEVP